MPLTLTLDNLQNHIVQFVSSTSIHITIGYMALLSMIVTNGRTDGRVDRHFSHMLIGHLLQSKDDLNIGIIAKHAAKFQHNISDYRLFIFTR